MTTKFYLEFRHHQILEKQVIDKIKELWKEDGNLVKDLKSLDVYFKAEEGMFYFIANQVLEGNFSVETIAKEEE